MKPILEINNISKKYKIGQHRNAGYLSLRESIGNVFKSKTYNEDFWALKDLSFNIYPGESIGIIGRNGAGKSTLLKILSRITPPSSGKIISRGRIASLLEVGTGFHPELTGRENIYLNGSILGLKRNEITKHFDSIVQFSGVEKFLDTPLKHYSSGMQLRLAFAVAAHLEPEILIIDEVLAVGDAEFQRRCIGKMEEVSKSGRTILFVSHNMDLVTSLCKRGILLNEGKVLLNDSMQNVSNKYIHSYINKELQSQDNKFGQSLTLTNLHFGDNLIVSKSKVEFSIEFIANNEIEILAIGLLFYNLNEVRVGIINLKLLNQKYSFNKGEKVIFKGNIEHFPLIEGVYDIGLFIETKEISGNYHGIKTIKVINEKDSPVQIYKPEVRGFVEFSCNFSIENF